MIQKPEPVYKKLAELLKTGEVTLDDLGLPWMRRLLAQKWRCSPITIDIYRRNLIRAQPVIYQFRSWRIAEGDFNPPRPRNREAAE